MKFQVQLTYDFEYGGYVADCPTLPGCMSQGKTKESALHNIKKAKDLLKQLADETNNHKNIVINLIKKIREDKNDAF